MAGERRSAARAIRHDFMTLVQKALIGNLLDGPPDGFDIVIVVGDIRVVHIAPISDRIAHFMPLRRIFPDGFLAFFVEGFHAVPFDVLFAVQFQQLFNFQLNRQAMRIPAGFAENMVPFHRFIARDDILDRARQNMADVRLAVCRRRPIIEGEIIALGSVFNFTFTADEIKRIRYVFVH